MAFFRNLLHNLSGKHVLTDEDRQLAQEIKLRKFEIRKEEMERAAAIQRAKDEKLISSLTKGDEDSAMLMNLLMTAMNSPKTSTEHPANIQEKINLINLSNEDIEAIISKLPPMALTMGRTMSNDAIKQFIEQKIGKVDDDTFTRIINRIRG